MMMPELREKRERFWKWVKIYLGDRFTGGV